MTEFYIQELFPSAIMFGMSSEEFWEQDPQLYWSYRTFYLKQKEQEARAQMETIKYTAWLNGQLSYIGVATALNNAFSKTKHDYPKFEEVFAKTNDDGKPQKLTKNEVNLRVQEDFNSWARM